MRLTTPLDDVLESRSHVRVLRALDALPEAVAVSAREIARRAGVSHPTASRILASFAAQGLTRVRRAGRADLYELNRAHALHAVLHTLFSRESQLRPELENFLRERLPKAIGPVREAYLFGSYARRTDMRPMSDIDLAVVVSERDASRREVGLVELTDAVRRRFGNELNVHLSAVPAAQRARSKRADRLLWQRVTEGVQLLPRRAARG